MSAIRIDFTVKPFDHYTDRKVQARIRKNAAELWRLGYSWEQIKLVAHVHLHGSEKRDNVRTLIAERMREIYRLMDETGFSRLKVINHLRKEAEEREREGVIYPLDDPLVQMGYIEVH